MKIVRLLSLACVLSLLAACTGGSVTGPDAAPASANLQKEGNGALGSGN